MFLLWLRQLPHCGDWTPASVPPPMEGRSSPSNTPVFPPSSFILPSFVWFCIFFSVVGFSCTLLAGVLHALLFLKVCSWCIHGERCTPCPPTPPPSCSQLHHLSCPYTCRIFSAFPQVSISSVKKQWWILQTSLICLIDCACFSWVSRSLWRRRGSAVACCRVGGTESVILLKMVFYGWLCLVNLFLFNC